MSKPIPEMPKFRPRKRYPKGSSHEGELYGGADFHALNYDLTEWVLKNHEAVRTAVLLFNTARKATQ